MKKWLKKIACSLLALLVLLTALLSILITTNFGLYTLLKLSQWYLPGDLLFQNIQGRLLDEFLIGQLEYHYQSKHLQINQLHVKWSFKSLVHPGLTIEHFQAKSLDVTLNHSKHRINSLQLAGFLSPKQFLIQGFQCKYLNETLGLQLQGMLKPTFSLSGRLTMTPQVKNQGFNGALQISTQAQELRWSGKFQGLGEIAIEGHLKQTQFKQIIQWHDLHPIPNAGQLLSPAQGSLKTFGNWPNLNLELKTQLQAASGEAWQMNAKVQGRFPMHWQGNARAWPVLNAPSEKTQGLHTQLSAKALIEDPNHGHFELTIHPGYFQTSQASLPFQGGKLDVDLNPLGLFSKGSFELNQNVQIDSDFKLPGFDFTKDLHTQALSGQLTLRVPSLGFLQHINPEISHIQGQLKAYIKTKGRLTHPILESQLHLSQASLTLAHLGLDIKDIQFLIEGKNHHWKAHGQITSQNKTLTLKGQGLLNERIQGDLHLQGLDFPLINTPEYQVNASPQLNLNLTNSILTVSGAVLVPYAKIKPQSLTNSLILPDDVVYKKHPKSIPKLFNTSMNFQLAAGQDVEISIKGLHAHVNGDIQIKQAADGPITANGILSVKQGQYKAFGQVLEVEQGQLIYTDTVWKYPEIHLRASKTIQSKDKASVNKNLDIKNNRVQNLNLDPHTKVGVEVSGPLSSPKIQLFSNPASLSQADILSMILLDRPASLVHESGSQIELLIAALSSMNLGNGSNGAQLIEQLKQSIGFDIDVQSNPTLNQPNLSLRDSTSVLVGKSLSKNLYLSYNMGLSQANPNVLTLKYLLNQFFSIQMSNSSSGKGMDVLYNGTKRNNHA